MQQLAVWKSGKAPLIFKAFLVTNLLSVNASSLDYPSSVQLR